MDKIFHFSSQSALVRPKGGYYSDAECQEAPQSEQPSIRKGTFASKFLTAAGSQSDSDSEQSDAQQIQAQLKGNAGIGKISKFKNQTAQQPSGDDGLQEEGDEQKEQSETSNTPSEFSLRTKEKKKSAIIQSTGNQQPLQKSSAVPVKEPQMRLLYGQKVTRNADSDAETKNIVERNNVMDTLKHHPYRHLIFASSIQADSFKKHLSLTYRGLIYSNKCLKGPSDTYLKSKQVEVMRPKNSKGKTLLLDLDETLIHSCALREGPDHIIKAKSEKGEISQIGLKIRPHCLDFLSKLTQFWDIYIFTASSPSYAEAIINFLDPQRKYISGILNRTNCMETKNGFFIKDLRIVKDANLASTVLVDNLSHSFGFQPDNGIPILEWHSDKTDQELKHLMSYLIQAAQSSDVREFNRKYLKLHALVDMKPEELGI